MGEKGDMINPENLRSENRLKKRSRAFKTESELERASDTESEGSKEEEDIPQVSKSRRLKNHARSQRLEETPDINASGPIKHSSAFNSHVRKIRSQGLVSSEMKGKIMSSPRNTLERFIADSGTTVPIMPLVIAKRNKLEIKEIDLDEPGWPQLQAMIWTS